jgi:hypothetical protein
MHVFSENMWLTQRIQLTHIYEPGLTKFYTILFLLETDNNNTHYIKLFISIHLKSLQYYNIILQFNVTSKIGI